MRRNRFSKLIQATSKLPLRLRSKLWSTAFGRIVPLVGTSQIQYLDVRPDTVTVSLKNHKAIQNHIGQIHACSMALLAETATGFLTAQHVSDDCIVLIKQMQLDFKKPSRGAMTATATLSLEQQQFIQNQVKGELVIPVTVTDEVGEPVTCQMLWAWVPKSRLAK